MLSRALLPCLLVAAGGCITIFDPDQVTYELQVRDLQDGTPVSGVLLQVEIGTSLEIREGSSDAGGLFLETSAIPIGHRDTETRSRQFTFDERTLALEHGIQERGASLCLCVSVANHIGNCTSVFVRCEVPLFAARSVPRPWMRVHLSREGYEPRTLDFGERDFIREGRRLRRMEAVTLQRKAS